MLLLKMSRLQLVNSSTGQKVLAATHLSLLHMQNWNKITIKLFVTATTEAIFAN